MKSKRSVIAPSEALIDAFQAAEMLDLSYAEFVVVVERNHAFPSPIASRIDTKTGQEVSLWSRHQVRVWAERHPR
jgi:hypothetical protein